MSSMIPRKETRCPTGEGSREVPFTNVRRRAHSPAESCSIIPDKAARQGWGMRRTPKRFGGDTARRMWIVREERPHSFSCRPLSGRSLRCPSRPDVRGRARQWPKHVFIAFARFAYNKRDRKGSDYSAGGERSVESFLVSHARTAFIQPVYGGQTS
jgi:hypothetical protein